MSDFPEPLSPADCDLRGYEFMPLHGQRLFGSALYSKALRNPRAGLAAIKLWWAAWQQCPAGSLPSDDDDLAMLADFGTDMKGWRAVRNIALHGFVLCSDGRLYHPLLCSSAQVAFEKRRKERVRKAVLRARKSGKGGGDGPGPDADNDEDVPDPNVGKQSDFPGMSRGTGAGRDAEVPAERREKERQGKEEASRASLVPQQPAAEVEAEPASARKVLYDAGLPILRQLLKTSRGSAAAFLGKMLAILGDDCPRALLILQQAQQGDVADPASWIMAAANGSAQAAVRRGGGAVGQSSTGKPRVDLFAASAGTQRVAQPGALSAMSPPEAWMHLADLNSDGTPKTEGGLPLAGGYELPTVAKLVADAADWPRDESHDWTPLVEWLRGGMDLHAAILPTVRRLTTVLRAKPVSETASTLRYFDNAVRTAGRMRA